MNGHGRGHACCERDTCTASTVGREPCTGPRATASPATLECRESGATARAATMVQRRAPRADCGVVAAVRRTVDGRWSHPRHGVLSVIRPQTTALATASGWCACGSMLATLCLGRSVLPGSSRSRDDHRGTKPKNRGSLIAGVSDEIGLQSGYFGACRAHCVATISCTARAPLLISCNASDKGSGGGAA